ncbi:uncharacterized protein ARMOST_04390 [Armillaria ostoyae]|uniref:Uncharacterized protein n=1 Tax=Armillaria ostoyae TaxID=47428 RepID=A0A284QX80_ARMOS|nr:uncharacterized protein ARMOST_04390 [Armillaria ostoyae]
MHHTININPRYCQILQCGWRSRSLRLSCIMHPKVSQRVAKGDAIGTNVGIKTTPQRWSYSPRDVRLAHREQPPMLNQDFEKDSPAWYSRALMYLKLGKQRHYPNNVFLISERLPDCFATLRQRSKEVSSPLAPVGDKCTMIGHSMCKSPYSNRCSAYFAAR